MARREIPEINAGSMADIAFLLLIFFLVTTTMDKDQAYIRDIPKKVELLVETPPPPVEKRNICAIKANDQNQLMLRNEVMQNPDDISEKIVEWYTTNAKNNDPTNNFPMFSRINLKQIEDNLATALADAEATENTPGAMESIIEYKYSLVDQWEAKKNALKLYGRPELPEIHPQAHIRVEVQKGTHYELFAKIQSEIEEGIYEVKDQAAMELFNESYGVIKRRYALDKKAEDKAKLDLLNIIYPERIIEVAPKR